MSFVADCIQNGITVMADIRAEGRAQLPILEKEIAEFDAQRASKMELFKEISALLKQSETGKTSAVVIKTSWNELSTELQQLCLEIITQFEQVPSIPATKITSQILDPNKRKDSITIIKWLMDQKILSRVGSDMVKGSAWDQKDTILGEKND